MATVIQIKRSSGATAPATSDLVVGEMAYAQDASSDGASAKLYMESVDSGANPVIHAIGGKYYTDEVDAATNANTASTIVKRDGSGNFSAGTITAAITGNVTGNVTGDVTGNADTATALATGRTIGMTGDVTWTSASFDGTGAVTGTSTLATVNSNVGSFGTTTAIPVVTVNAKGLVTAVSTATIATSFDIAADSGSNDTVAGGETLTFNGTSNEITTAVADNAITIGLATNPTIGGNLTVSGDLTISGNTTTVNTSTLSVEDPLIVLANGNSSSDAVDVGFYGLYDTSGSLDLYAGLFRDASDSGKWKLFKDSQTAPTTTVDTGATGYAVGTLVANLEGNVSGGTVSGLSADIVVADGGTGAGTFTSNGIIYGNGTGALQATAAGTDGYFLVSNSGTPDWSNVIDGGTY